jgi:hypothetical protein
MADRFPLIVDAEDSNIKELPQGDNLDLDNSNIVNLTDLTAAGTVSAEILSATVSINADSIDIADSITANSIVTTTSIQSDTITVDDTANFGSDISVTGAVDAANYTVDGSPLSSIQIQSDWTEQDDQNPAYIANKPTINNINELDDIPDVFVGSATLDQVLRYDGVTWQASDVIDLSDFSGTGPIDYNSSTGVISFDNSVTNYITLTDAKNNISFDDVTSVFNETTNEIIVGAITAEDQTSPSSFQDIEAGSINVFNDIQSSTLSATVNVSTPTLVSDNNITVNLGSSSNRLSISQGFLRLSEVNNSAAGEPGDIRLTNSGAIELYSSNIGTGGWFHIGGDGFGATRGLILPFFTTAERDAISDPQPGETILNSSTNTLQVYNGVSWITV